ncbi:maltokinase N-terminal cap-like domain-containing protein [Nocardioides sp. MAHUQ-72]|uniref:maltokinase N-terminal cap-like domain-containing protein n=1 Tax=unclassified Nocardioides TaxID=2615069 RepID=UPI00361D58D9
MTEAAPQAHEALKPFIENARWFGGKGREFSITGGRRLGEVPGHVADGPRVAIDLVTLSYEDGGEDEYYQVPLSFYPGAQSRLEHALVGVWHDEDFGTSHVYDAVHDREAMACWLRSFDSTPEGPLAFHRLPGHELDLEAHSTLFSGEQSNSSVAFGEDSLLKVFRKITPGVNPDIAIHEVLTRAGSPHVASLYGWLECPALLEEGDDRDAVLQLAMLQQFLRTATDGWDLALASVRNLFAEADLHADEVGGDFAGEAARLGQALAETHVALAGHFPVEDRDSAALGALADAMNQRLDAALEVVAPLRPYADELRRAFDALRELPGVRVQRIHGDLHLGQTLRTVRGWKIVDFEGEPAKPLAERSLPDSPWRDVAGMLRSFDYAPRVVERTWAGDLEDATEQRAYRAAEWSARNREAFLSAYAGRDLTDDERTLLEAYVADKAVYETVYETRNRPTWVAIPLEAVARIGVS